MDSADGDSQADPCRLSRLKARRIAAKSFYSCNIQETLKKALKRAPTRDEKRPQGKVLDRRDQTPIRQSTPSSMRLQFLRLECTSYLTHALSDNVPAADMEGASNKMKTFLAKGNPSAQTDPDSSDQEKLTPTLFEMLIKWCAETKPKIAGFSVNDHNHQVMCVTCTLLGSQSDLGILEGYVRSVLHAMSKGHEPSSKDKKRNQTFIDFVVRDLAGEKTSLGSSSSSHSTSSNLTSSCPSTSTGPAPVTRSCRVIVQNGEGGQQRFIKVAADWSMADFTAAACGLFGIPAPYAVRIFEKVDAMEVEIGGDSEMEESLADLHQENRRMCIVKRC